VTTPKLIAVDLDGTLLDKGGLPHRRDVLAIRAALAAGVRVSIATGRLYSGTRPFVETLGLRGAVACADGSHLVHATDHATLMHHGVRGSAAALLRDAVARAGVATFVFAKDAIGHDAAGAPYVDYVATWSRDIRAARDIYGHELWTAQDGVTAVVALGTEEQICGVVNDLARDLQGTVLVAMFPTRRGGAAGAWATIVRAAGTTKGTAVRWIAEREEISLEETVCVGDWVNDVPMFEVAGRSFAMGQAPEEVKAKATDVLPNTVEDGGGVALAIERAFGIRVD
jgi:Cof subfamily protein (haloacid dehalogenase superfamily)